MPSVVISTNTSGDNTLIAAKSGCKIRVLNFVVGVASAVSLKFKSAANDLTGAIPLAAPLATGWGPSVPAGVIPQFETNSGEALILNLSSGVLVSGWLNYDYVAST